MPTQPRIENAYAAWGERFALEGWTPYLLSFMFRPIGGSAAQVAATMEAEVVRVYATFVTRVVRSPQRQSSVGRHPVWMCSPDYPVHKHRRGSRLDVFVNDGRHVHALAFQPPFSRLREDLSTHFEAHRGLYLPAGCTLDCIDVEPVTRRIGYVVGYGRKSLGRGRVEEDGSFILPRSLSEM